MKKESIFDNRHLPDGFISNHGLFGVAFCVDGQQ